MGLVNQGTNLKLMSNSQFSNIQRLKLSSKGTRINLMLFHLKNIIILMNLVIQRT
ncbi:hypothetical protein EJB05_46553 [Eragrostis curvula]|uniref:Uncharacterized protein n=1 Tax=Eragrostis curvula TaxID=38414 RepID=A0A5J9TNR3_9POAL|nr:hypothetical protein EJB05_46553 [Eragrostis curvula]